MVEECLLRAWLQKQTGNRVSETRVSIREKPTKGIGVRNHRVGASLVRDAGIVVRADCSAARTSHAPPRDLCGCLECETFAVPTSAPEARPPPMFLERLQCPLIRGNQG